MGINNKLLSIQSELKAPKNQFNSFGKYNYRSCEDILEAVKPLCKKFNSVLVVSDNVEQCGDRAYIKSTATLFDCETDEYIESHAFAREAVSKKGMDDAQVTGSTSSYARKYALNGLFCIDDTKDADGQECVCSSCGKEVNGVIKNGQSFTAEEVYNSCNGMCTSCYKKANANGN